MENLMMHQVLVWPSGNLLYLVHLTRPFHRILHCRFPIRPLSTQEFHQVWYFSFTQNLFGFKLFVIWMICCTFLLNQDCTRQMVQEAIWVTSSAILSSMVLVSLIQLLSTMLFVGWLKLQFRLLTNALLTMSRVNCLSIFINKTLRN